MKILQLTTTQDGGAGIACMRLHHALRAAGIDSKVLSVFGEENKAQGIFSLEANAKDFHATLKKEKNRHYRQAWKIRLKGKPKELFSFPGSHWKIEKHPLVKDADVIHLHWIARMIDVERFFSAVKKPIVWTMHDAWPFTGGFHYESYFNTKPFASVSDKLLEIKRNAYAGKNITLVAPGRYLTALCKSTNVFEGCAHLTIPNSVPAAVYYPRENRNELREKLGIKEHEQAWFFASGELDYFRKGADILLNAFAAFKNQKVKLFIAGKPGKQQLPNDSRIHFTGHIADENQFAELLTACDALIHTSREDNFPNIILESLFCGTPVLSIDKGGVSEMVRESVNGFLVSEENLLTGFEKIVAAEFDREKIAEEATTVFSAEVQVARYRQLYADISGK